jgi:hypothetical protein
MINIIINVLAIFRAPQSNVMSNLIVTGGADGLVMQYEIYQRKREISAEKTVGKFDGPSWNLYLSIL